MYIPILAVALNPIPEQVSRQHGSGHTELDTLLIYCSPTGPGLEFVSPASYSCPLFTKTVCESIWTTLEILNNSFAARQNCASIYHLFRPWMYQDTILAHNRLSIGQSWASIDDWFAPILSAPSSFAHSVPGLRYSPIFSRYPNGVLTKLLTGLRCCHFLTDISSLPFMTSVV